MTGIVLMYDSFSSAVGVVAGIIPEAVDLACDKTSQNAAILAYAPPSEAS